MSVSFVPPTTRPHGAFLQALLRKLGYATPELRASLTHLEAQWSAEFFDPDWLAQSGIEALPALVPAAVAAAPPVNLDAEGFKRLCQGVHRFETLGLSLKLEGKPQLRLQVLSGGAWELQGLPPEGAEALKALGVS